MANYCLRGFFSCYFYILGFSNILAASLGHAVVPSVVINAGEVLKESYLKVLDVTNSNLQGNYAHSIKDVVGLITRRTLWPGHVIPLSALHRPYIVVRGEKVRIILSQGNMTISASAISLSDASIGDVVSVKNSDTNVVISGTVMSDRTIRVEIK
ncbi:MAG: flagellar basal body P-ring formation protein FlgA [Candidatus Liberibacter ctenarytainae]|uniref:Flagella basal body P-ring formation protein FlgA n=1 Tax=Candidatus Liberibacter ctenarytainae TaxID=2020335 RepID=A0A937APL2_9HYPH|nr:flagellar basal body P-ring formation protein FlgA [Candidatus Liberibacter ctenarytainae]